MRLRPSNRLALAAAPLGLLAAVIVSACVTVAAVLRGRTERRSLLESSRSLATALAAELGLPPPRPCALPWREGLWQIDGEIEARAIRLLVGPRGVEVSFVIPQAAGLSLARDEDFGRGGILNPSDDPYRPLSAELIGPGWWVRGADGPRRASDLPRQVLAYLRDAGTRPTLVDGRMAVFVDSSDATVIADASLTLLRALREP